MTVVHTETLRVVSGQRVEGTPPGAAILPPPLRRSHSRRESSLLVHVDLGADFDSHLCREMRDIAAQSFWSSTGSVTAALRRAISSANESLFQSNLNAEPEDRRYGGITCVALLEDEIFVAQAGQTWSCVLFSEGLDQFPKVNLRPLGSTAYAGIQLAYVDLQPGDTLLVGTRWLHHSASDNALLQVMSRDDLGDVLDGLEQVGAGGDFSAVLARWSDEPAVAEREPPPPVDKPTRRPPVERARPREKSPKPREPRTAPQLPRISLGTRLRSWGQSLRGAGTATSTGLRTFARRMLPGQDQVARQQRRKQREIPEENPLVMSAVALAILALVTVVTLLSWLNQGRQLHYEEALTQAQEYVALAQEADSPDQARDLLQQAVTALDGLENYAEAQTLLDQAQTELDQLDKVISIDPVLLWDFGPETQSRRMVVRGQSIFVLDSASSYVYRLTLTGEGDRVLEQDHAEALLGTGQSVDGQLVGELQDITWAGPGGERTENSLISLEDGRSLISFDPDFDLTSRIFLGALPENAAPVAQSSFDGKLYLLDPPNNQIWRYLPRGGGYPDRPEAYFGVGAPQLGNARDMAIDGSVYVLFADGSLAKYFESEAVPLEITGVPSPEPHFIALTVSPNWTDGPIFVADAVGERIVVLMANGSFNSQLRAPEGAFNALQSLALDETPSRLFILAGGRLYVIPLSQIL